MAEAGSRSHGPGPGPWARRPLLALAFAALAAGTLAGLARLGWGVPRAAAALAALHGPLMAAGFFGTVISLERAVGLGRGWAYGAPLAAAAGALALLAGEPAVAAALGLIAALTLLAAALALWRLQPALHGAVGAAGAAAWALGQGAWLATGAPAAAVPWWAAFLVLTVAAERLELARVLAPPPGARRAFAALAALLLAGAALAGPFPAAGRPAAALALAGLGLWLLRHDVARRNLARPGMPRFLALALLAGHAWLLAAGLLALAPGAWEPGPVRDAFLHALFLGFVLSMVFGHAPLILPAVAGIPVPWTPLFYGHLLLLETGVAVRVAGDLAGHHALAAWGGLLGALALALFVLVTVVASARALGRARLAR